SFCFYIYPIDTALSPMILCFLLATATSDIYTLSLHDALPILRPRSAVGDRGHPRRSPTGARAAAVQGPGRRGRGDEGGGHRVRRSEEHTSELQSRENLVCRLLLEKKKKTK